MNPPPSLREIQRAFARAIAQGRDAAATPHIRADGIEPAERLDVYRGTFTSTLTRALRLAFPAIERLVGAEFFEAAARAFLGREPPRSACLDDYGEGFPAFLSRFAPAASLDYLPDVASLEWAVNRALHAADAEPLAPARLAALRPDEMGRVRFVPHPAACLLRCDHPADSIWRAVLGRDDAALAALDPAAGPVRLLVWRAESGVDVERLDEDAWGFSGALFERRTLDCALEAAPRARAQAVLAAHLAAGRFVDFSLEAE